MQEQDTPPYGTIAGTVPSQDSDREVEISALEYLSAEDLELMAAAEVTPPPQVIPPVQILPPRRRPLRHMGPREFGTMARATFVLALCGFSLAAFFVQLFRRKWIVGFVGANTATTPERNRLLIWIAAGTGAGILLALALWPWGKAKARTARVMRTARLLSPAILRPGSQRPLTKLPSSTEASPARGGPGVSGEKVRITPLPAT